MAAETKQTTEREYVIPLRSEWMKVPRYKRTRRSVKEIKSFIARHMRVPDRDVNKIKLDVYLNNEMWFRGGKKPPAKIKVRAKKEGENVFVELAEAPEVVKFAKARAEKRHKKTQKKKPEVKTEDKKEEKTEEERKEEVEKEKSVAEAQAKAMEKAAKAEKHLTKMKEPVAHRKALKK